MALITDLPSNTSPSTGAYMITDNGTTTSKSTLNQVKAAMGIPTSVVINYVSVPASGSVTVTLESQSRGLMVACTGSGNLRGLYLVASTSTGAGTAPTTVLAAPGLTMTAGTGTITVANSQSTIAYLHFIMFAGSASANA